MNEQARERVVAAFDFDGTVSERDTLVPFMVRFAGPIRTARGAIAQGAAVLARRPGASSERDEIKAAMLRRLVTGRQERDLDRAAGDYAAKLIDAHLREEMVDEIRRHVAAGHETLFVSASLANYLRPIARYLNMTDVIAVELDAVDGVLSGEMRFPNVRAAEKERRLRDWLGAAAQGPIDNTVIWAYGNSSGDHELLEMAQRRYWLGKPAKRPAGVEQFAGRGFA